MKKRANRFVHFTYLLMQGLPILTAAKQLSIPKRTAYKWAHRAVAEDIIEPACKWPLIYRKSTKGQIGSNLARKMGNLPLVIPHKFGGTFLLTDRPKNLKFDSNGRSFIKEGSHTVQFGRVKTIIWIKHFRGTTVPEILTNAYNDLMALSKYYENKYSITLTLERVFDGIEWTIPDRFTSAKTSDLLGIKDGEQKEIAKSMFKNGDESHPGVLEINQAPGQPVNQATKNVRELEYLLMKGREEIELLKKDIISVTTQQNELAQATREKFDSLASKEEPKKPFGEKPIDGKDYI